jgi:hypothetical protein
MTSAVKEWFCPAFQGGLNVIRNDLKKTLKPDLAFLYVESK